MSQYLDIYKDMVICPKTGNMATVESTYYHDVLIEEYCHSCGVVTQFEQSDNEADYNGK